MAGRVYDIDITRFLSDKASFWSLGISAPPCERSVLAEAKNLGIELPKEAKAVIKDGSRFVGLPREETKLFSEIRSKARQTFDSFAQSFPFLPPSVIAVANDRLGDFKIAMNKSYVEFEEAKSLLCSKLEAIRQDRESAFVLAGDAVFDGRDLRHADGSLITRTEFRERWLRAFGRCFPKQRDVERTYKFDLREEGSIKKNLSIATRDEFLADAETAAKLEVIAAQEAALKKEFYDFAAAAALNLRLGLLQALSPVLDGMEKASIGTREIAKIEKHIAAIRSNDVFGDEKLADMLATVTKATDTLKQQVAGFEAAKAQTKLMGVLEDVKDELRDLEFSPLGFRKLELELDGGEECEVFADKDVQAEIREAMNAKLADTIHELASHGGTDEEKRDKEQKLRNALHLKRLADEGLAPEALDTAARIGNLDLD